MRLIFCYIVNYRNIQHQAFDFGSEYTYTAHEGDNGYLHITREENKKYIPGLYKNNLLDGFENITAIVGENGSGKSSLLSFLGQELFDTNNIPGGRHRISIWDFQRIEEIGEEAYDREIEEQNREADTQMEDVLLFTDGRSVFIKTANISRIRTNFGDDLKNFEEEYISNFGAIFYSPIYNFDNEYVHRNISFYVDVSSNTLLESDSQHHDNLSGFGNKTIELHKLQNTARQLDFIITANETAINLKLPEEAVVTIYPNDLPSEFQHEQLWNTDRSLSRLYNKGYELWHDETDKLFRVRNSAKENEGAESQLYINTNREIAQIYALHYLWRTLISHIDRANHYLTGYFGNAPSADKVTSLRELIISFINSQSIIKPSAINLLNDIDKLIVEASNVDNVSGLEVIRLRTSLRSLSDFIDDYQQFLSELPNTDNYTPPTRFIHFEWGYQLSSGERAYIDLFSRFYFAIKQLLDRHEENSRSIGNTRELPSNIYLLMDEGELGFHLQWQKEYITKLITYLSKIITYPSGNEQPIKPALHLILTTHSPISLSDIAQYNIIYMERRDDECVVAETATRPNRSFGANIHDLLHDAFFLRDGFIGQFAHNKIDEIIKLLIENKPINEWQQVYIKQLIDLVDEPIIKVKLKELYAQKIGLNVEIERINAQIEQLQKQKKQIEKRN